jgi:hypothetical protein
VSNAKFVRDQMARLNEFESALNKLEERKAVLETCGMILAEQNI